MPNIINTKVKEYLSSLNFPESTRIIITDLDKTLFDTSTNSSEYISTDLLKYLLSNVQINIKQISEKNIVNIFKDKKFNENITSQIILPIYSKRKCIIGSIILLNCSKNKLDNGSIKFLHTIKHNVEFYSNTKEERTINKYENNPLYDKRYIKRITDIIEDSIDDLFVDTNYRHLEELLYFKIDSLKNKMNNSDVKLIDNILNLLEEKKEYYAMYAISLGIHLRNIAKT